MVRKTIDVDTLKRQAAEAAVEFVESGMVVGLGHGSTAIWALRKVAERLAAGELTDIVCIPCSRHVAYDARDLRLPLGSLDEYPVVDVTIDGADEFDPRLNLVKGGGGALLREKMVAQASKREIIVCDSRKAVQQLGESFKLPVEVTAFGREATRRWLETLGCNAEARKVGDGTFFTTDQGNQIIDCDFGPIVDPYALSATLNSRAGVVEHGLFLDLVDDIIVAGPDGLEHLRATR